MSIHAQNTKHTDTHIGQINITSPDIHGHTFTQSKHRDFDEAVNVDVASNASIEQENITYEYLLRNMRYVDELGRGAYGTAYRIILLGEFGRIHDFRDLVVKFSNDDIYNGIIRFYQENPSLTGGFHYTPPSNPTTVFAHRTAFNEMRCEFKNALRILAPFYQVDDPQRSKVDENFRLKRINRAEFTTLQEEARRCRAHPGYNHVHHIIHFDPTICCILSEKCDGTLDNIIQKVHILGSHTSAVPGYDFITFHRVLMKNLMDAVDYLRFVGVAHQDIKPSNVLFKWQVDASGTITDLQFIISDFGLCSNMNENGMTRELDTVKGTFYYRPSQFDNLFAKSITITKFHFLVEGQMVFAMAATILESMISIDRNLVRTARYEDNFETFYTDKYACHIILGSTCTQTIIYINNTFPLFKEFMESLVYNTDYVTGTNLEYRQRFNALLSSL
jgi:serine/threonine protein kinase